MCSAKTRYEEKVRFGEHMINSKIALIVVGLPCTPVIHYLAMFALFPNPSFCLTKPLNLQCALFLI